MGKFIRRIYYDNTGIVFDYMMKGDILHHPQSKDYEEQPALQGRSLVDTPVMEWLKPDPVIEDQFARATNYSVINGELTFDFTPLQPIQ
jgi:hypothetical protein